MSRFWQSRQHNRLFGLYCISAGRPGNVPFMQELWRPYEITWVVPEREGRDYLATGAHHVLAVETVPGVMPLGSQRNAALEHAFAEGATCIQTDDDAKRLLLWKEGKAVPCLPEAYVMRFDAALAQTGALLTGCAPLPNAFYSTGQIKRQHWIMAQLFAAAPSAPRFDPDTCPREDYDFTCQHLATYGGVARHDALLPDYRHWGNRGGCQDWRTDARSAQVNALLLQRWPQYLKPNPRREGELLLKVKGAK